MNWCACSTRTPISEWAIRRTGALLVVNFFHDAQEREGAFLAELPARLTPYHLQFEARFIRARSRTHPGKETLFRNLERTALQCTRLSALSDSKFSRNVKSKRTRLIATGIFCVLRSTQFPVFICRCRNRFAIARRLLLLTVDGVVLLVLRLLRSLLLMARRRLSLFGGLRLPSGHVGELATRRRLSMCVRGAVLGVLLVLLRGEVVDASSIWWGSEKKKSKNRK